MRGIPQSVGIFCLVVLALLAGIWIGRATSPPREGSGGPGPASGARPRVVLVGLDGADWEVLIPLAKAGRLPNLLRILETGARGKLRSIEPILSPLIWTSIATGKTPDKHGILDFMAKDPATNREIPTTSNLRRVKALWNILGERGRSVGVVGWLATYPAERVAGFVVTDRLGYLAYDFDPSPPRHATGKVFPDALWDEVAPLVVTAGGVPAATLRRFVDVSEGEAAEARSERFHPQNPVNNLRLTLATAATNRRIAAALARRERPDLLLVYFEAIDAASHLFMQFRPPRRGPVSEDEVRRYGRAVDEMYVAMDEALGEILAEAGPEATAIVASDHGFHAGESRPAGRSDIGLGNAAAWHRLDGVFAAAGPGVRRHVKVDGASVLDIAPTVLALLGLPVAADMDGRVLEDALDPAFLAAHPIARVPTYEGGAAGSAGGAPDAGAPVESPDDAAVRERLVSLGYVSVENTRVQQNKAFVLLAEGRLEEAASALESAIAADPADTDARLALAPVLAELGRADDARRELEAAFERRPELRADPARAGALYRAIGDRARAEALFREALSAAPDRPDVHAALGALLVDRGDLDGAERSLKLALARNPDHAPARVALGRLHLARKAPALAAIELRAALGRAPRDPEALLGLAGALEQTGERDEAAKTLKTYLERRPRDLDAAVRLATIEIGRGRPGEAIGALRPFERSAAGDVRVPFGLGLAHANRGQYEQAEAFFRRVLEIDPRHVEGRFNLGNLLQLRGELDGAIAEYRAALEAGPDTALVHYNLALALGAAHRYDEAKRALDRAAALDPKLDAVAAARRKIERDERDRERLGGAGATPTAAPRRP